MNTASPLILPTLCGEDKARAADLLKEWHATLQQERGWRAELRRADTPAALLLSEGFRALSRHFRPWLGQQEWRWLGLALAAGVAAHVTENDESASFAAQLGKSPKGSDKPRLSPLRFSRLTQAHDSDEFYRLMIRAVCQLGGKAHLVSLVDGVLLWCREQDELARDLPVERSPFQRPALRWATEYFQASEE